MLNCFMLCGLFVRFCFRFQNQLLTYIKTNVKITFTDWLLALLFFVRFVAKLIQIMFASFILAFLLSGQGENFAISSTNFSI